jgi:uncharacterized membrane protein
METPRRSRPALDFLILLLAFAGFLLNLWLFLRLYSNEAAAIAGCGGGDCEEVLASRWSRVFHVPVTVFGAMAYAGLMASLTPVFHRANAFFLGAIGGAALWFVFVQAVLLGKFCPWCLAAHGLAATLVLLGWIRLGGMEGIKRLAFWGSASFLAIGLSQVYGPVSQTHRMEDLTKSPHPAGRTIGFDGGNKVFRVDEFPLLGSASAKHVMVEYFDYECPACATMAGYLDALMRRHPQDISVICLPVPMDGACNRDVPPDGEHPGSCRISRIALAVWLARSEEFPKLHHELFGITSPDEAEKLALKHVSPSELAAALADPQVDRLIQSAISDWKTLSRSTPKLPKLFVRDRRILHGLPSGEEDFIRVMERELGL